MIEKTQPYRGLQLHRHRPDLPVARRSLGPQHQRIVLACSVVLLFLCLQARSGTTPRTLAQAQSKSPSDVAAIVQEFTLPQGFNLSLVAKEPDIVNPMTMCVDESGVIYVTEAHTYRWGTNGSPFLPPTNPIKQITLGPDGRAIRTTVVADGFPEPVVGICARAGRIYATCLNEMFSMDIGPDGKGANRRLLVKDAAVEWNPFGMYRVQVGPDDRLWLSMADHPKGQPVELTGSDGAKVRLNGKSGGMVRCRLDGSQLEIVTQGLRAPYAFDIDPWGHLWYISNGEGSPNIFLNVIPGMDYGYASRNVSYNWLAGAEPLSPPVIDMGAGANTSALHYYSSMLPRDFWGDIFISNWGSHGQGSRNRMVTRFRRERDGASRIGTADIALSAGSPFLTTTNDPMFRPTGMVLAPDGGLFLIDWHGQDDENDKTGRIFKITYTGNSTVAVGAAPVPTSDAITRTPPTRLIRLLNHPNHLVRELAIRALVKAGSTALKPLGDVAGRGDPLAAANAIWALTRMDNQVAGHAMAEALKHPDSRVRAHALRQMRGLAKTHSSPPPETAATGGAAFSSNRAEVVKLARARLLDPSPEVRVEAALCLDSSEAITRALLKAFEITRDRRLCYQIGLELARHGDSASLKSLWQSDDLEAKRVALIAMENARYENTALASLANELTLQDFPSRFSLLVKLGGTIHADDPDALTFLGMLESGAVQLGITNRTERLQALQLVEAVGPKSLPEKFIIACLSDNEDAPLQRQALLLVRQRAISSPACRAILRDLALGRTRSNSQLEAVATLAATDPDLDSDTWLAWCNNPSKEVVVATLRALRQSPRKPELIEAVIQAVAPRVRTDPDLREELSMALRMLGIPSARLDSSPLNATPPRRDDKPALAEAVLARLGNASPALGRLSFLSTQNNCAKCHSIRADIVRSGPLLADIGAATQPQYLIESILEPSKILKTGFMSETVETRDGKEFTGLVQADGDRLTIIPSADERVTFHQSQIKQRTPSAVSLMPEGLDAAMTDAELADLIAFLVSLKSTP